MKQRYNDFYAISKGLLTGSKWYEAQAYRALNQALGRCLRHRNDWAALILVDQRFSSNPTQYCNGLSKWVRDRIQNFSSTAVTLRKIHDFTNRLVEEEKEKKFSELNFVCGSSKESNSLCDVSTPDLNRSEEVIKDVLDEKFSTPQGRISMGGFLTEEIISKANRSSVDNRSISPGEVTELSSLDSSGSGGELAEEANEIPSTSAPENFAKKRSHDSAFTTSHNFNQFSAPNDEKIEINDSWNDFCICRCGFRFTNSSVNPKSKDFFRISHQSAIFQHQFYPMLFSNLLGHVVAESDLKDGKKVFSYFIFKFCIIQYNLKY